MISKNFVLRFFSSIILLPLSIFLIFKGGYYFITFILILSIINFIEWFNMSKNKFIFFYGSIFLVFSTMTAFLLRGHDTKGLILFLFVITICVSSDIGGYVFGNIFKGPKLTKISPNKTYSGMFGALILSLLVTWGIYNIFENIILLQLSNIYNFNDFLIDVIIISLVSQIGDITISYFKRLSNLKNTGNLIPGHGGLLDRVDGIIFSIPACYIISIINY